MSLNHIVNYQLAQPVADQLLDVHFANLQSAELQAICGDDTQLILNPPTSGAIGQSLQSDGNGGLIFINSGGPGGMGFTGNVPVAGQHIKSFDTTGNLYERSTLVEDSTSFNFDTKDISTTGDISGNNITASALIQTPQITSATSQINFSSKDLTNVDTLNCDDIKITNDDLTQTYLKLPSVGSVGQYIGSNGDSTVSWQNIPPPITDYVTSQGINIP